MAIITETGTKTTGNNIRLSRLSRRHPGPWSVLGFLMTVVGVSFEYVGPACSKYMHAVLSLYNKLVLGNYVNF